MSGRFEIFSEITQLAKQIGLIESIKDRLFSKPDKAAEKLAESLDELYKMFKVLDDEIVSYLSLNFDTKESIIQGRTVLLGLEVGQSKIHMHEARGHCATIKNIQKNFLNGWFEKVFTNPAEKMYVENLFNDIGTADALMINAIKSVTQWLTTQAQDTLTFLDSNQLTLASSRVKQSRIAIRDDRINLADAMGKLRSMQADFKFISQTV